MKKESLKKLLDAKVEAYNAQLFIETDPVSIPHLFTKKQDIEITGLLAATLAWGQRVTILKNCRKLINWMDHAPHDFMLNHQPKDLKRFEGFVHRTFNDTDLLYFLHFLQWHYRQHASLEWAFAAGIKKVDTTIEGGLNHFRELFFSLSDFPARTKKHVASPAQHSACKRLCMYLRWMVRSDNRGVDFGIWKKIKPAQLQCPLDLHSGRTARNLGLLTRSYDDWKAVCELTDNLRAMDNNDPVKYDFALYGMGVFEGMKRV
ncbi:MAG: TIGR02757 family protein [Bacteroidia bacterium]|nr:TIGR02757 family protein [Bacteroidia bacterium]